MGKNWGISTQIWTLGALVWMVTIIYFSLANPNNIPDARIFSWDKIVHAAVYFFLAVLFIFGLGPNDGRLKFVLFFCVLLGIILEFLQGYMNEGRNADVYDAIANTVGVVFGYLVCVKFLKS